MGKLHNSLIDEIFDTKITEDDKNNMKHGGILALQNIMLDNLEDYPGHDYPLYEGAQLDDLVESIKAHGIMTPLVVRGWKEADSNQFRFQILSGHNRRNAGLLAGVKEAPAHVKWNLSDDEAQIYVDTTNLIQRGFSDLLPSHKARILERQYGNIFSQGRRTDIENEILNLEKGLNFNAENTFAHIEQKYNSREIVAQSYGLNRSDVARYLRVGKLIEPLKELLDAGKIGLIAAVNVSFLSERQMVQVDRVLRGGDGKLDVKRSALLREYDRRRKLDDETIRQILAGEIKEKSKKPNRMPAVKVRREIFLEHFGDAPPAEAEGIVEGLLAARKLYKERYGGELTADALMTALGGRQEREKEG
jgi:ParB family chromosome partitioning protein